MNIVFDEVLRREELQKKLEK